MEMVKVGDGATVSNGRDRNAATVIAVDRDGKQITVQHDTSTLVNEDGLGIHGVQNYTHERNKAGMTSIYTLRKNGRYVLRGDNIRSCWCLGVNGRSTYQDPHF